MVECKETEEVGDGCHIATVLKLQPRILTPIISTVVCTSGYVNV